MDGSTLRYAFLLGGNPQKPKNKTHMHVHASFLRLVLLAACAAILPAVHAQVGVSNLSSTHNNGTIYPPAPRLLAQSFTTDSSATYFTLDSVSLMLYQSAGTIVDFTVTVRSDDSAIPGSLLGTLAGNASPTADFMGQQYTYTASGVTLAADTTYWITWGFTDPVDAGATFIGTPVQDTAATGQWTLGANRASFDAGATWPSEANGSFPLQISIQATAIPEPGTYAAMLGVAALGLTAWRRRRTA
jgi:PEP-CTERM motif